MMLSQVLSEEQRRSRFSVSIKRKSTSVLEHDEDDVHEEEGGDPGAQWEEQSNSSSTHFDQTEDLEPEEAEANTTTASPDTSQGFTPFHLQSRIKHEVEETYGRDLPRRLYQPPAPSQGTQPEPRSMGSMGSMGPLPGDMFPSYQQPSTLPSTLPSSMLYMKPPTTGSQPRQPPTPRIPWNRNMFFGRQQPTSESPFGFGRNPSPVIYQPESSNLNAFSQTKSNLKSEVKSEKVSPRNTVIQGFRSVNNGEEKRETSCQLNQSHTVATSTGLERSSVIVNTLKPDLVDMDQILKISSDEAAGESFNDVSDLNDLKFEDMKEFDNLFM